MIVPDNRKSLDEGAIYPWAKTGNSYYTQILNSLAKYFKFSMNTPFNKLTKVQRDIILYGSGEEKVKLVYEAYDTGEFTSYRKPFEGVVPNLRRRYDEHSQKK